MTKPTIVFVPGAWLGPEIYSTVMNALTKDGYPTIGLPLPSAGAEPPHSNFDEDTKGIRKCLEKLIEGEGKDVILVSHSYTGMPASEASVGLARSQREEKGLPGGIVRIVFVAALAMAEGFVPTANGAQFPAWMRVDEERGVVNVTPDDARAVFFNDLSPEEANKWVATLRPQSAGVYDSTMTYAAWRDIPSTYVIGAKDQTTFSPEVVDYIISSARKEVPTAFDAVERCDTAGHCPMISHPEWFTGVMRRAAAKHFINNPDHLVVSALHSITLTNPTCALDAENRIVYLRPDASSKSQVSVVSGGGAGHEPSFSAFVGRGLLSAAVAGTIFASPSAEQVRRCILERVDASKGVLVVVMNYTGDVLNFGMAVEKAKAAGLEVEMIVMGDDAGVGRAKGGKVGRRGIAGTVLVHKIAGALAAQGKSLGEVHRVAKLVADNTVSIGSSLSHVHVPGREAGADEEETLNKDEVEIGMGIHNEPGSEKTTADLPGLVATMLKYMLDTSDKDRGFLSVSKNDDTVLLVNNLGGVSVLEMGGITAEVVQQLSKTYGLNPKRILSGIFMTSLNGLGFSISLLKLQDTGLEHSMLDLLDASSECSGWSAAIQASTWSNPPTQTRSKDPRAATENKPSNVSLDSSLATKALKEALQSVISAEPEITKYDTVVGDGDCGTGLKRGAEAISKHLSSAQQQNDAALYLDQIIGVVETTMDGTSGALYAIFLNAVAAGLRAQGAAGQKTAGPDVWAKALQTAMESMSKYTPAKPGDRTLVDALAPFVQELEASGDVGKAARAAEKGAAETKGMKASLGRTVYVGGSGYEEVPDPGAYGLAIFFKGLAEGLK